MSIEEMRNYEREIREAMQKGTDTAFELAVDPDAVNWMLQEIDQLRSALRGMLKDFVSDETPWDSGTAVEIARSVLNKKDQS